MASVGVTSCPGPVYGTTGTGRGWWYGTDPWFLPPSSCPDPPSAVPVFPVELDPWRNTEHSKQTLWVTKRDPSLFPSFGGGAACHGAGVVPGLVAVDLSNLISVFDVSPQSLLRAEYTTTSSFVLRSTRRDGKGSSESPFRALTEKTDRSSSKYQQSEQYLVFHSFTSGAEISGNLG